MDTQQFEVIRPKCAGLDVHKKSVVAAVCTSDPVTLTASYKTKVFNTTIVNDKINFTQSYKEILIAH